MKGLVHRAIPVGPFQCNCHILADEATGEGVVIDPGDEPSAILSVVRDLGIRVTSLVHTHCHLDHLIGTRKVREETGAKILIHRGDQWLYDHLKMQFEATMRLFGVRVGGPDEPLPVDGYLEDGGVVKFGSQELQVLHTPGHTPGSCSLLLEDRRQRRVFSGDTLFAGSIGRTDLWAGNLDQELESIRTRLFALDPDTVVYPGHGPETTIRGEREGNPFLQ